MTGYRIDAAGRVCLDVGASTGGFTDCLLQRGASRVYAVDVGYGQMAWKLRQDTRVIVIERTNIRYMPPDAVPEPVDLVTIDASFISLKIVVPAVLRFLKPEGMILPLVKPQFEVCGMVGRDVVTDPARGTPKSSMNSGAPGLGLAREPCLSVLGPKGNREFSCSCDGRRLVSSPRRMSHPAAFAGV
jgi:23S rRNA (cytidine1920-2'-O)/16S rRNA (cytidine1409-2'-O)-methyltransferase